MPLFLVESSLPEITVERLAEVNRGLIEACEQLTHAGKYVRFVRTTFLPGDSRVLCVFDATDPSFAMEASESAQVPYERIANAFEAIP